MERLIMGAFIALLVFGTVSVVVMFILRKLFIIAPAHILHRFVEEQSRSVDRVDPDAPIEPNTERRSSEYMKELANQAKSGTADPAAAVQTVAPPSTPPQRVQKVVPVMPQTVSTPVETPLPVQPPVNPIPPQPMPNNNQVVVQPSPQPVQPQRTLNPLVENDMPIEPVVNAQAASMPVDVSQEDLQDLADDNVYIPPKSDKLEYGVRSASYSPNRILRDKRYRRNSAG